MRVQKWQPGQKIIGPAYIDTNIWVGYLINRHPLFTICARLISEILQSRIEMIYSHVVYQEMLWAIASQSYADLYHRGRSTQKGKRISFGRDVYRKNKGAIWTRYGPRFTSAASLPSSFAASGIPITCVPNDSRDWLGTMQPALDYMKAALESADAVHLSLAGTYANTFITADKDFVQAAGHLQHPTLTILHVQ